MRSNFLAAMLIFVSALFLTAATNEPPRAPNREALVGNRSLGGMVFGGTTNERVQFNEQTLWLGSETEMGSYQPFGDVFVEWSYAAPTNYRREPNLPDAIHRVSYRVSGVTFAHEAFSSYPDQVMVLHFTADKPGACSGVIRLADMHQANIPADANKLTAGGSRSVWKLRRRNRSRSFARRTLPIFKHFSAAWNWISARPAPTCQPTKDRRLARPDELTWPVAS